MLSNLLLAGPPVITSEPDYVRDPGLGTAIPVVRRSVVIDEVEVSQIRGSLRGFEYWILEKSPSNPVGTEKKRLLLLIIQNACMLKLRDLFYFKRPFKISFVTFF